jgi:hypothetical protein
MDMGIRILFAALLVTLTIFAVVPTIAQDATPESSVSRPLLDMLRFVPDTADYRQFITYGDQAAWYRGWGFQPIPDRDTLLSMDNSAPVYNAWTLVMGRQTTPPEFLGYQYMRAEDMRSFYGFDLLHVDRYLQAGIPPDWIGVADFSFDPAQIASALTASGYSASALESGAKLYSLHGDYELSLDRSVPHVGQLGGLNRIALLGQQLVIARATVLAQNALQTHSGAILSLAENPAYIAGVQSLNDPSLAQTGELVGAILVDGTMFTRDQLCPPDAQPCDVAFPDAPLPAFDLAVFATLHTPGKTSLVLALVFPESTDATGAAASLGQRMKSYQSIIARRPLMDILHDRRGDFDLAVDTKVNGRPVALVVLHDDDPSLKPDSSGVVQSSVFDWFDFIAARDVMYLVSGG